MLKVIICLSYIAGNVFAFNNADIKRYQCTSGNCVNGVGTVFEYISGISYTGEWKNSCTIVGSPYRIFHPKSGQEKLEIFFSDDGLPEKGVTLRTYAMTDNLPKFRGSFKRIRNPFLKANMAAFKEGVYDTAMGIEYRGRFDYIPVKGFEAGYEAKGYFIFYGDRVDTEENETISGLFISEATPAYAPIQFSPARPDYLSLLNTQYLRDLNIAADDFRQQENAKMWKTAFKVFFEVGQAFSGNSISDLTTNAKNDFVIDLVTNLMNNTKSGMGSDMIVETMSETILAKMTGDKTITKELSKAVVNGIKKAQTNP